MRILFTVLLLIPVTVATAGEYRPYVSVQSITYSQPIAIDALDKHWNAPFKGGETALTYNKAETGVAWKDWQLGIFRRYDYLLEFSRQTAELFYLTENHLPLEVGKEYPLHIEARHHVSRGLRLGFRHKMNPSLSLAVSASYLQGLALTDGQLNGTAQATAEKDYDFQFNTDYAYSRDVLFERHVNAPQGNGYSLDLKLDWQPNRFFSGRLFIVDLMAKIYWNNVPYTTATATSDVKTYDDDGYVRYHPSISGLESNRDLIQDLPRKIFLEANYQWTQELGLIAQVQDFEIQRFTQLGADWTLQKRHKIMTLFNIQAKALTLGYQHEQFLIELASDAFKFNRARYLSLKLAFNTFF
jgi:hypothetical protein